MNPGHAQLNVIEVPLLHFYLKQRHFDQNADEVRRGGPPVFGQVRVRRRPASQ